MRGLVAENLKWLAIGMTILGHVSHPVPGLDSLFQINEAGRQDGLAWEGEVWQSRIARSCGSSTVRLKEMIDLRASSRSCEEDLQHMEILQLHLPNNNRGMVNASCCDRAAEDCTGCECLQGCEVAERHLASRLLCRRDASCEV